MSPLPPALRQKLLRSRLGVRRAVASVGIGERRSRAKGAGIEFADHRSYQFGDDIRHLDPHLYGRLGEYFVRQFTPYRQLPVTVLLDASASMAYGAPTKFAFATELVAALSYLVLTGSDRVRVGILTEGRVRWSERFGSVRRAPLLFDWLERQRPRGATELARALRSVAPTLPPEGLTLVVSDWWSDEIEDALGLLRQARQEVVAIQLLAPEELEPERLGSGPLRLLDVESGQGVELALDADALCRYRGELERWTAELRSRVVASGGRFLAVRSDADLERLLLQEWRAEGVIG